MTTRSIYAWLVRRHPQLFRDRFAKDMLWVFDETVPARGGLALIVDAALSLVRQWLLRPNRRKTRVETAPESGTPADAFRTGWYRGLTPEIHSLILFVPLFCFAAPLGILSSNEPLDLLLRPIQHAALALLTFAWYRLYKRRLLRSPLVAPLCVAHLPYRLQLEDSLKTIGTPVSKVRSLVAGVILVCIVALWNIVTAKLGYGTLSFHLLQLCYFFSWVILRARLNRYATQTLQREIDRLPTNL